MEEKRMGPITVGFDPSDNFLKFCPIRRVSSTVDLDLVNIAKSSLKTLIPKPTVFLKPKP